MWLLLRAKLFCMFLLESLVLHCMSLLLIPFTQSHVCECGHNLESHPSQPPRNPYPPKGPNTSTNCAGYVGVRSLLKSLFLLPYHSVSHRLLMLAQIHVNALSVVRLGAHTHLLFNQVFLLQHWPWIVAPVVQNVQLPG